MFKHLEGLLLMLLSIMKEKLLLMKNIHCSRLECRNHTLFLAKISTLFMSQTAEKPYHTLLGRSYLYSPFKGVLPPGPVYTSLEEIENGSLSLRLGLPSTLIHREKRALQKLPSSRRNLKNAGFAFSCGRKTFC